MIPIMPRLPRKSQHYSIEAEANKSRQLRAMLPIRNRFSAAFDCLIAISQQALLCTARELHFVRQFRKGRSKSSESGRLISS